MPFTFHCVRCGQELEAEDDWAGTELKCPGCQSSIIAPYSTALLPQEVHPQQPIQEEIPSKENKKGLLIIGAAIALVGICGFVLFFIVGSSENSPSGIQGPPAVKENALHKGDLEIAEQTQLDKKRPVKNPKNRPSARTKKVIKYDTTPSATPAQLKPTLEDFGNWIKSQQLQISAQIVEKMYGKIQNGHVVCYMIMHPNFIAQDYNLRFQVADMMWKQWSIRAQGSQDLASLDHAHICMLGPGGSIIGGSSATQGSNIWVKLDKTRKPVQPHQAQRQSLKNTQRDDIPTRTPNAADKPISLSKILNAIDSILKAFKGNFRTTYSANNTFKLGASPGISENITTHQAYIIERLPGAGDLIIGGIIAEGQKGDLNSISFIGNKRDYNHYKFMVFVVTTNCIDIKDEEEVQLWTSWMKKAEDIILNSLSGRLGPTTIGNKNFSLIKNANGTYTLRVEKLK